MTATDTTAICAVCGKERNAKQDRLGGVKLPQGWKREGGTPTCNECWKKKYVLRALTFPVAQPLSGSWKDLEAALRQMWIQTTAAINWMMTECYIRDVRRNDEEKIPPMPRVYLYPEARMRFPALTPRTVAALEQTVQRKYRAKRFDVNWTASAALPTARYPQPLPVPNQGWDFDFNEQNQPIIKCRIGDSQWMLRLKSGPRYRRQIAGLKRMEQRGEMAIYKARDGTTLVKLVGWLTRTEEATRQTSVLLVRTGRDHLLSAFDTGNKRLWVENRDSLPGIIVAHRRRLQRLNEDQKPEQRPIPSFAGVRSHAALQYRNRINSVIQEVCAHLGAFAARQDYGKVIYDDSERWIDSFPYFRLAERLRIVLDEHGIEFERRDPATLALTRKPERPLAEEQSS